MIELTGIGSILRGMSFLYWLLAIGALALVAWKVKRWPYKAIGIAAVVGVFSYLPAQAWQEAQRHESEARKREAYAREAWAYFKKLCDEKSGEKIYKTFTGVKSVVVVKPLPPASENDLFDQFWYGDPYSDDLAGEDRGEQAATKLIGRRQFTEDYAYANGGYDFIELPVRKEGNQRFQRMTPLNEPPFVSKSEIANPESRFGISWEDISTPEDRKYWVAGSRLRVFDLATNSVVAERIGYLIEAGFGSTGGQRRPWQTSRGPNTTCPTIISRDHINRFFVLKVLRSGEGIEHGK